MKYRKALSQHVLLNQGIARRIAEAAGLTGADDVLEIGAGTGMLTKELASRAGRVLAVECDPAMIARLKQNLSGIGNVTIVKADFLRLPLGEWGNPVIVGNIPYSITTPIIERLIEGHRHFRRAVLTVQKEYGERLLAQPGSKKYGSITVFANYYFVIKRVLTIPPTQFIPRPKVASLLLTFDEPAGPGAYRREAPAGFFDFIRRLFQHRRKKISTTLKRYFDVMLGEAVAETKRVASRRAEELTIDEFLQLYRWCQDAMAGSASRRCPSSGNA